MSAADACEASAAGTVTSTQRRSGPVTARRMDGGAEGERERRRGRQRERGRGEEGSREPLVYDELNFGKQLVTHTRTGMDKDTRGDADRTSQLALSVAPALRRR